MRNLLVIITVFIALTLILTSCYSNQGKDVSSFIKYAPPMKDLVSGKTINLNDYSNKLLVLEFFETWCPACNTAIPELNKFYKSINENNKTKNNVAFFSILSPSSGDEKSIKEFIKNKKIEYPVLLEEKQQLSYNLEVKYIPTLFFIKDSKIVYSKVGPSQSTVLMNELLKFVK